MFSVEKILPTCLLFRGECEVEADGLLEARVGAGGLVARLGLTEDAAGGEGAGQGEPAQAPAHLAAHCICATGIKT